METRKYIVRNIDAEDEPIIKQGVCQFYIDDKELVPDGFILNVVQNSPNLKEIFVNII